MRAPAIVLFVSSCAILAGCVQSLREGPQVPRRPDGFLYDANASAAALVFPARRKLRQFGYFRPAEPGGSIIVTQYPGATQEHEARHERNRSAKEYAWQEYGGVEHLMIDGRPAWGWTEIQRPSGKTLALGYTAVVSYDDVTFTVEFNTDDPALFDPIALRESVESFVVAR